VRHCIKSLEPPHAAQVVPRYPADPQTPTSELVTTRGAGAQAEEAALLAAGQEPSSALHRAAIKIQAHFRGYVVRKAYKVYRLGGAVSEILYSPAAFGLDMSVRNMPKPRPRINAQVGLCCCVPALQPCTHVPRVTAQAAR
jgi:hypothetical protein